MNQWQMHRPGKAYPVTWPSKSVCHCRYCCFPLIVKLPYFAITSITVGTRYKYLASCTSADENPFCTFWIVTGCSDQKKIFPLYCQPGYICLVPLDILCGMLSACYEEILMAFWWSDIKKTMFKGTQGGQAAKIVGAMPSPGSLWAMLTCATIAQWFGSSTCVGSFV